MINNNSSQKTKKLLIVSATVVTTIIIASIFLSTPAITFVTAFITLGNESNIQANQSPVIESTINVIEKSQNVIGSGLNVSFAKAAETATSQFDNSTLIIGGHLDVVGQGNLVYKFFGANHMNNTMYQIYVDPGNGAVLYKSDAMSLKDFYKHAIFFENRDYAHGFFGEHERGGEGFFGFGHWKDKWINSHDHNSDTGLIGWLSFPH